MSVPCTNYKTLAEHDGCPACFDTRRRNDAERGGMEGRARIVTRLRARATSEEVNADRSEDWKIQGAYRHAAQVLRDEAQRLEDGA